MDVSETLPKAASESREEGFDAFYRSELVRAVRRVALMVGSVPVAEDIVHDKMIELYSRWGSIERPGAYLRRSCVNAAARRSKLNWRNDQLADLPDREADHEATVHEFVDLLAPLTIRQRAVIVLRYYDGLTEAEIAETLRCRPGSVGPLLSRARTTLKKEWTP